MDNILDKIYSHYLDIKEIEIKKKEILSLNSLKILINTKKESYETFYNTEKYFIKITNNNINKDMDKNSVKKYNLTKNNLFLSKFPKEILINNLLKKELYNNIINIHNYYFSEDVSILVMDRDGELFIDFFNKNHDNMNLLNSICKQLVFILAILQDKFQFMHKNLNYNNIIIKKYNDTNIKYKLKDKEYDIETFGYIPVLYNFSFSTIFKINDTSFEIYDKVSKKNMEENKSMKKDKIIETYDFTTRYKQYILNNNYFISSYDLFYFIISFKFSADKINLKLYNTDIINRYSIINNISLLKYSESYLSMYDFLIKYTNEKNNNSEESTELKIDQETIDKYKNAIIIIVKNGLGNKLMTIINLIYKYSGKPIYFIEQLSHHQNRSFVEKLRYIFPNLNTDKDYSIMSWKLFDALQKEGIKETEYQDHEMYYTIPGFINLTTNTRNLLKMNSNYDYLLNKYDLKNGIFVHYRLGDKFELNFNELQKNKVCKYALFRPEYYVESVSKMLKEKPGKVYILSDSIKVAECLLKDKISNAIFVNEKTAETFYLMTHCNRFIISESSMTVCAVYLNNNNPQVIVPNFLIDPRDKHKLINNIYFNDKIVSFNNNKEYLLNKKDQYDKIYKLCYRKN
jgi:hypothetical protein